RSAGFAGRGRGSDLAARPPRAASRRPGAPAGGRQAPAAHPRHAAGRPRACHLRPRPVRRAGEDRRAERHVLLGLPGPAGACLCRGLTHFLPRKEPLMNAESRPAARRLAALAALTALGGLLLVPAAGPLPAGAAPPQAPKGPELTTFTLKE